MKRLFNVLAAFAVLVGCWQLLVWGFSLPHYLLPTPWAVLQKIVEKWDVLLKHAGVTLSEMLLGLLLGFCFGVGSALVLTLSRRLSRVFMPILVLTQAIPVFAIAPLLVLWLGFGMASKVAMAVLIIYFPVVMACYDGLRNTPTQWLQLAESMRASRLTILLKIRLPAALPSLASGLRVAVTFAPIGAVIGEWVGSAEGLGYLMLNANARMRVDMTFAALLVLIVIQLTLFFGVDRLLKKLIPWESKH
ncbi:MAG: ABC transporter permease [Gammaproteobacteria bacterium]|nr:MAG: ABC transporter permease [Gammaproteobacteria bacterium]